MACPTIGYALPLIFYFFVFTTLYLIIFDRPSFSAIILDLLIFPRPSFNQYEWGFVVSFEYVVHGSGSRVIEFLFWRVKIS